jgi:colicin import membrane protein
MKKFALAFFLIALSVLAGAQTAAPVPSTTPAAEPGNTETERARISAERARLEAGFLAEDVACYKKFAVNSCLGKVNARRREALADLRRQEISLNDEERRIKGAEQLRRTEEKSSPERQQEAASSRAKALEDAQSRQERDKNKQQERAAAPSKAKANSDASAAKIKSNQQKAQARSDKQAVAAEEAKKFNDRQKESQARRVQHESERIKQTKPPAKSLPLPEKSE